KPAQDHRQAPEWQTPLRRSSCTGSALPWSRAAGAASPLRLVLRPEYLRFLAFASSSCRLQLSASCSDLVSAPLTRARILFSWAFVVLPGILLPEQKAMDWNPEAALRPLSSSRKLPRARGEVEW